MTAHLRPLDLTIVAVYLIGITLFGLRFRKKPGESRSVRSYFLADNTIPWWAIALSIVSAETSTLTIISIPGVAFAGDFGFLQIVLGYMLGRIVVALLFLPRYFRGEMLTAYQLIDQRFGSTLHKVTAGLFLLTRAAAEGVRVFAVSIVVGIAIGTRDVLSIAIISVLTLLYTFEGGMAAVIWTDVVQMAIYIGGTLVAIWTLGRQIPGGWSTIHTVAGAAGKFHLFNFALNLTTTYTFWAGILGGTFLTMASHGTDQLMVQRMLAARSLRESRLALLSSGVVIFIQFTLFLLIGAGLYVFYGLHPQTFLSADRIFPTFIVRELPLGLAGLLVAAILAAAMSNLSAALNSLSSTTVVDFYLHLRPAADDRERSIISKSSTVLWALVLFAIAIYSLSVGGKGHVVEIGLSIASVAYGCLLGVFLLGTLTKFATQTGAIIGMVCGFILNLWLWQGTFPKFWVFSNVGTTACKAAGDSSCYVHVLTIPHIAFTWYVLIGALVTFAIGSLFSLLFRKQSHRTATTTVSMLLLFAVILSAAQDPRIVAAQISAVATNGYPEASASGLIAMEKDGALAPRFAFAQSATTTTPDFSPISQLITTAIAAHQLPGAVVLIGHDNKIVFEQAYGNRKLAGEPGLTGQPTEAEPMTEDTIFDMASLTKCLATATAIMQLYEQGKITSFDDPVEKYLPAFNESHDPTRAKVTLRMLLTHTSGEAPDVDLRDPWGLAAPDRAEGLHRALTTALKAAPGSIFTYSDINFILLGDIIETLSGQREDDYVREHIFLPLGMTDTRYLPIDKACGEQVYRIGAAIMYKEPPKATSEPLPNGEAIIHVPGQLMYCNPETQWSGALIPRIAPTAHDDESKSNPSANPHFDMLTRGTVHDPTARRMGGVAGHAGVFSTAHDISLYASALLEKLLHNTGPFPLKRSTLQLMTTPEQPGHTAADITHQPSDAYPSRPKHDVRGFGWDIDSDFSRPRGTIFPIGSFGHTGFTGTSLWMDPASDTYVILLANAIHPRGNPPISHLRGDVATAAAKALGLDQPNQNSVILSGAQSAQSKDPDGATPATTAQTISTEDARHRAAVEELKNGYAKQILENQVSCCGLSSDPDRTLTGIDVLEATHFAALSNFHHLGLLTNHAGLDSHGIRTIDALITNHQPLTTLFSPEHGINGTHDDTHIANDTDPTTHLPVISLYGAKDADRRPTHAQLANLDAVIIDLQDAGVRFWTYEAATSYFLEAAAIEKRDFHHNLEIIVLDRPNPIGGVAVQGPISDPGTESYTNTMPLPVRHGLTLGELMRYYAATKLSSQAMPGYLEPSGSGLISTSEKNKGFSPGPVHLTVIPMQHWSRTQYFADTGLTWVNPSPNLRSPDAAILYPALGLIETTNVSVGRGTDHPFSFFGAGIATKSSALKGAGSDLKGTGFSPSYNADAKKGASAPEGNAAAQWFNAEEVAAGLTARHLPGVTFTATTEAIADDANHYPFHGQTIPAVRLIVTDRTALDTPELGIEILAVLHRLYPTQFQLAKAKTLLSNQATLDAITRGEDPRTIAATWQPALNAFRKATKPYLLYP